MPNVRVSNEPARGIKRAERLVKRVEHRIGSLTGWSFAGAII